MSNLERGDASWAASSLCLTRLSGFAAFAGVRSLFINELDGKVFTTEADPVSVGTVIPIALCIGGFCRPSLLGPPRGPAYSSLAEGTHAREQRKSSLQPFSACSPNIGVKYHGFIIPKPDQHRIFRVESGKTG